jgi:hypothetical protein
MKKEKAEAVYPQVGAILIKMNFYFLYMFSFIFLNSVLLLIKLIILAIADVIAAPLLLL